MNTGKLSHAARVRKAERQTTERNVHTDAMDALLEKQPPHIVWRKNNRGVWVHVSINDPHTERPWLRNLDYLGEAS